MVKGLNALFVALGLYTDAGGGYLLLNAIGDGLFHFMPLFLGYTAAKKFSLKPMIGLVIGAIMCYPAVQNSALSAGGPALYTLFAGTMFESAVYTEFFGLPLIAMDYTGTVIPVIFVVYFASKCEKFFSKFIPDLVKFFFVPMLTLFVAIPVYINNIMTNGYDNVMMPFFACTFATSAVVLAVFFKTKNKQIKEMAIPNFISGIFGVTEPAIYGILLPLKKPFIISCIAGGIGGGFYGAFNFRKFMMGGMGIFEFPAMIEPDGGLGNLAVAVVGVLLTMVIAFVGTMIFYKETDTQEKAEETEGKETKGETKDGSMLRKTEIASPIKGQVLKLSDIKDEAFASGVLGRGAAILPEEGSVYAPADGEITALFPTLHALGMKTEEGAELLIHIGLDTVQLNGEGFEAHIQNGDKVKKGQLLITFDKELLEGKGYCLETPVLITNSDDYLEVLETASGSIRPGEELLKALR